MLRALRDQLSDIVIILLTAQGSVETAVEAIKEGAYDYLTKPVDTQRLLILLKKAAERQGRCAKCACCAGNCASKAASGG